MKNFMVLGASALQIPLIQQVRKKGYNVVVVSPHHNEPGVSYADYFVEADVRDKETILEFAKKYNIVGITTDQTDIPVRTAAYVAEKMGLPGIGYDTACLFTDKYLMREKCKELGLPTVKYKKVKNIQEAVEFFKYVNSKVILKPVDNQGSKGVSIVSNIEELYEKYHEAMSFSMEKAVLIEQFIKGKEYVVEGVVLNYEYKNIICGEYHHFEIPGIFASAFTVFPVIGKESLVKRIQELNEKIITGFGLKNGRTHSEFIVTEEDEIYLIETAARGGGVFISSDIVPLITGFNSEDFLIGIATNNIKDISQIKKNEIFCCCLAFYLPVGEIVELENVKKVVSMPFTHRNNLENLYLGMKTKSYKDKTGRYFIVISGTNPEILMSNVEAVKNTLKIKVKTNSGIKGPIWN